VEKAIKEALGEDVEAVVDMWNPWPWTVILDNIAKYYKLDLKRTSTTINTFLRVFETIDVDGSGTIDTQELYTALLDSGIDISEEGVSNLFGIIDEDGNGEILESQSFLWLSILLFRLTLCLIIECLIGDIERDEWINTIDFYLELKEEEAEMHMHKKVNTAEMQQNLREKKLQALHLLASKVADVELGPVATRTQDKDYVIEENYYAEDTDVDEA
jgi:hypothetical protein